MPGLTELAVGLWAQPSCFAVRGGNWHKGHPTFPLGRPNPACVQIPNSDHRSLMIVLAVPGAWYTPQTQEHWLTKSSEFLEANQMASGIIMASAAALNSMRLLPGRNATHASICEFLPGRNATHASFPPGEMQQVRISPQEKSNPIVYHTI